ncbi:aminoglycoside phosphotransferase family protein [Micromonospora sp. NPDC049107]|uniref:phosphotransferase family protein n=1 Tax=unclassified Micromonospora TaxID=2617518 RepID=UPI0033FFB1B0
MTWTETYDRARSQVDAAAGYYNHNIRVEVKSGPVIVRIPIHGADVMDLRLWREEDLLPAIAPYVIQAPRLLFLNKDPAFQIHQFIPGDVLNDIAPRGTACPPHVPDDVARLLRQLADVPRDKLPPIPADWPADGDSAGFGRRLAGITQWIYDTFVDEYRPLFDRFGIPDDPLTALDHMWPTLTSRPFVCVHADVHRKNIIVDDGTSVFLDWELALWGDPVYDLAVHLHKMTYLPAEETVLLDHWQAAMPPEYLARWEPDLDGYLGHERIKSSIVDTIRYAQLFVTGGPYPYPEEDMIRSMAGKLNAARPRWGMTAPIGLDDVRAGFADWVASHRSHS